jgi:NAD(P)-dependent dehydrogenase (short-subunit alcohol dehydrogenase family)
MHLAGTNADAWSLEGTRIVITGAASGLGRAMADAFAAAGAQVAGVDTTANGRPVRTDGGWWLSGGDITSEDDIDSFFTQVEDRFGGIDCVIGNAGVRGFVGPIESWSLDDWQHVCNVNLTGQFIVARRAVQALRQAERGRLILVSSAAGRLAYPERCGYSASKWGVVGLAKTLARELGPAGIRVNAVLPGLVRSPGGDDMLRRRSIAEDIPVAELEARFLGGTALGEWIEPADIVNAVRFLCSAAGAHVSGQTINVCGFAERL